MRFSLLTLLILAVLVAGCAGSAGKDPIGPSGVAANPVASQTNRHLWGIWDVFISADRETVEIAPLRTADMHLNAVRLLEVTPCKTCLTINAVHVTGPNELSVDVTLTHPYPGLLKCTAFDVRGIFISTADFTFPSSGRKIACGDSAPRMLDPDGYSPLFNPTEFPPTSPAALGYIPGKHSTGGDLSANLNPFVAYRKDAPRRMFESGGSETKTVKIHAPTGPIHFGYAVDACWEPVDNVVDPLTDFPLSANCLEPYRIDVSIGAGLLSEKGSHVPIQIEIYDHQGQETISTVTVEAPELFNGEIPLSFSSASPNNAFLFAGTLPNDLGAADGEYPLLVRARDWGSDQNLGNVAAWQVARARVGASKGWALTWGGLHDDWGNSVAIDGSGSTYITGWFHETVDFDPGAGVDNQTSNGSEDAFLSKFDPSGSFIWARIWGGPGNDHGNSVAIDSSGNVYVLGSFEGIADFDPGAGVDNHTSNGKADVFISKFDPNGIFVSARTWGGSGEDEGLSVAIDGSGNAHVTGYFSVWGTVDFDPGAGQDNHTSNGHTDAFLSKFDPNGNFVWACTWGGGYLDEGLSVAIDGSGNAYVSGRYRWTVDFDPGAGVDNHKAKGGNYDAFLSKFDPNGSFIWARTWGAWNNDEGFSAAIDDSGNAYVTGRFSDTVDFDPGPGVDNHGSNGESNTFLSKFDPNGNFVWARTWGGSGADCGYSVAIDDSGNAYITGRFGANDPVDFDPGAGVDNHLSKGLYDVFLSKFDPNGIFVWARTWARTWVGPSWDDGGSVAIDSFGNAYVTGYFAKTVDFDPGAGVDSHKSNGEYDAFLSKFPPDGNW